MRSTRPRLWPPDEEILSSNPGLRTWIHEATPLAIRGVLYTATSLSQIVALDAGTGETLWVHDPGTWKRGSPPNMGFVHRGVAYWQSPGGGRIFAGTGDGFLIALEAATGEPVAGFGDAGRVDLTTGLRRPVDRDLYGVTSPPIVCRDVVIVGFVFDRVTGEPLWPTPERPVPASDAAGERASPTQPFPTRPPAFDRQGVTEDDLIDFTPELRAEALDILDRFDHGSLYTPPSEVPALVLPGPVGGASWAGAAADPRTGMLYVPSVTKASVLMLVEPAGVSPEASKWNKAEAPGHAYRGLLRLDPPGPRGLPLFKPPYGRVTAIDLTTGELAWTRAIGSGPRDHQALAGLELPPLGWPRRSLVLLTEQVLFVAQQGEWRLDGMNEQGNAVLIENQSRDAHLLALDPRDGSLLAEIPLPGNATGSPMTYLHEGRQLVVLPIGGGKLPAELVALALP